MGVEGLSGLKAKGPTIAPSNVEAVFYRCQQWKAGRAGEVSICAIED